MIVKSRTACKRVSILRQSIYVSIPALSLFPPTANTLNFSGWTRQISTTCLIPKDDWKLCRTTSMQHSARRSVHPKSLGTSAVFGSSTQQWLALTPPFLR